MYIGNLHYYRSDTGTDDDDDGGSASRPGALSQTAAAAVCAIPVTRERMGTGPPRVAPTQGRRAAGQLNRRSEVVVLLSRGTLTTGVCAAAPHLRQTGSAVESTICCGMRQGGGSNRYEVGPVRHDHALREREEVSS